jgi:Ca-activated chloride channel family protein
MTSRWSFAAGILLPTLLMATPPGRVTQGTLMAIDPSGNPKAECPLKHTDVKAEIAGFLVRVTVTQEFENNAADKIEAVYAFPLPPMSAVDDMTMYVGTRTVKGTIKRREEARAIYEAAKNQGRVAALLDQERPNIFTQSVANIMPHEKVKITISYVERLKYEAGTYEFRFPMVVGPRYIPGQAVGRQAGGWAYDSDQVPDASRITPPVAVPGTRAGHDIAVQVALDAGVPIDTLSSITHDVAVERTGINRASIKLRDHDNIPNKDFVLKYDVAGKKMEDAILTHRGDRGGFFSLILQPPERVRSEEVTPKELVFVLDTSGSMSGFPIEKAKEAMRDGLDGLNPNDTFNFITFSGETRILFPHPVAATRENIARAKELLAGAYGSGGTEMMKAVRAALEPTDQQEHVRVVCFMTDGYIGNDDEIIQEIRKHPNARVFSFGIGSSVNHYLLDKMAEAGRGEVEYVGLKDDGSAAARRFYERVRNPLLTDIRVDWGGLPVAEVYPARVPDLFSAKPIAITGKFTRPAKGTVRISGNLAGRPYSREIAVDLPASQKEHDVLATLWARTKIDDLTMRGGNPADEITKLGLDYRLMTQYTSFVAVEEMTVTDGGKPRTVQVPVELPEGVSYEGIFGPAGEVRGVAQAMSFAIPTRHKALASPAPIGGAGGVVNGVVGGFAMADRLEVQPPVRTTKLSPNLTGANLMKLVKNGKIEVQVWLVNTSPAVLNELRKFGFEIIGEPKTAKMVFGRIAPDKLQALSQLGVVTYIDQMK